MRTRALLAPSWAAGAALLDLLLLLNGISTTLPIAHALLCLAAGPRTGTTLAAAATTTMRADSTSWEFRTASDSDITVMTGLLRQKSQFHLELTGERKESFDARASMLPAHGNTLTSLFPELPSGQVLLIHEKHQPEIGHASDTRTRISASASVDADIFSTTSMRSFSPSTSYILEHPNGAEQYPKSPSPSEGAVGFALYALRHYGLDGSVPPSLWLHALFVEPSKRSGGAGKALMDELASLADGHSCSHLGWKCHVDNTRGQGFYEKVGASIQSQTGDLYSYSWVPDSWSSSSTVGAAAATGAASPR